MRKLQRALMTTQFDGAAQGSAKANWAFMPEAKPDSFGFASLAHESSQFQVVVLGRLQKPDRYWFAPLAEKKPANSGHFAGYVRRSESISPILSFAASLARAPEL